MRPIYILLLILVSSVTHSQIINFPDINFKNKVIADGVDTNNDGEIQISEAEAVTNLDVGTTAPDPNKITDITGIEYFVNLTTLRCSGNEIPTLDASPLTQLTVLKADFNELTSLDVTGLINLDQLWISHNQLTSVDISTLTSLTWIYCTTNQLSELNVSNLPLLEAIWAGENQIGSIDLQSNSLLQEVLLYDNLLTEIDVLHLDDLISLRLDNNVLTEIDVTGLNSLFRLWVGDNDLDQVDISMSGVGEIHCENNPNLTYINAQNGVISDSDPDLLFWGFLFLNLPSLEIICMDPGEEYALSESGYNPSSVTVTSQPDCSLSVDDFNLNKIKLFPNPVGDSFNLQSEVPITSYAISNIAGQYLFFSENYEATQDFVVTLNSGLYFLTVEAENANSLTLKFIKKMN